MNPVFFMWLCIVAGPGVCKQTSILFVLIERQEMPQQQLNEYMLEL